MDRPMMRPAIKKKWVLIRCIFIELLSYPISSDGALVEIFGFNLQLLLLQVDEHKLATTPRLLRPKFFDRTRKTCSSIDNFYPVPISNPCFWWGRNSQTYPRGHKYPLAKSSAAQDGCNWSGTTSSPPQRSPHQFLPGQYTIWRDCHQRPFGSILRK